MGEASAETNRGEDREEDHRRIVIRSGGGAGRRAGSRYQYPKGCEGSNPFPSTKHARVAELVDALVSGTSARKGVRVRVSPRVLEVVLARVAELADAVDLGSTAERRKGSTPFSCTLEKS